MELRRGKAFLLHEEEENMSGFSIFCKLRGCVTRAGMTLGWRAHQLGQGRRNILMRRLQVESDPKLLSFKQNDSGITKLETREGIHTCGSGWWQSGLRVELNESCAKLLAAGC